MSGKTVLVVDDQKMFREAVAFEMEMLGFQVEMAEDGQIGFNKAKQSQYALIISDIRMPNWDGPTFLREFRKVSPCSPPFVLMTGYADIQPQEAFAMGADAFLGKPLNPDQLARTISYLSKPYLEQFSQVVNEKANLVISGDPRYFEIGRRGFFVGGLIDPKSVKVNELVRFEIKNNQSLIPFPVFKGIGCVRWARNSEDVTQRAGLGIEILNLIEPTPAALLEHVVTKSSMVVAIPKGTLEVVKSAEK